MRQLLLSCALFTLLAPLALAQQPASSPDQLQTENTQLRAQLQQLQAENAQLRAQIASLTQKTVALETEKAQQQAQLRDLFLSTDFDPASNTSTLFTTAMKLKMLRGDASDHYLTFSTSYPGTQPPASIDHLTVNLSAWFSGDIYRNAKSITLDIDGSSVECPITHYDVQRRSVRAVKKTIDRSDALITAQIPASAIHAIGSASTVTGKIGHVQFQFPREINEACKALSQSLPH